MNQLVQLRRQLQYLFIALLFAGFAVVQSAKAVGPEPDGGDANATTVEEGNALAELSIDAGNGAMDQRTPKKVGPNKWVIPINFTMPLPDCAAGNVIVHADLVIEHGRRSRLEGFNGTAVTGNRKLVPTGVMIDRTKIEHLPNGDKVVEHKGENFKVTGPGLQPGARPFRFQVTFRWIILEIRDGKIMNLKAGPLEVFCLA